MKLDAIDLKILQALHRDSRISISDMAGQLGMSRPTIKARINKMEKAGVIKRFTIVVDRDAVAENLVLLIRMKAKNPMALKSLQEIEEISEAYQTSGNKNIVCKAIVQSKAGIEKLLEKIGKLEVEEVEAEIVLKTLKDEYEVEIGPEIGVTLKCEYCGNTISGTPFKFKLHNRERYFCCPICLKNFRKKVEI